MKKLILFLVALGGLFGVFSIRLVEYTPSHTVKLVIVAVVLLALAVFGLFEWKKPHRPARELRPYLRNPARRRSKRWGAIQKRLHISVPSTGGERRDTSLCSELLIRNLSRRPLPKVELPLAGDSWARSGDLTFTAEVGGERVREEVRYEDGNSPVVSIPLPAPGLAPKSTAAVNLSWSWPGMASIKGGVWIMGLGEVLPGVEARVQIDYPADLPQHAQVKVVRAVGPIEWDVEQGAISPRRVGNLLCYEFACMRGRLDSYLSIEMQADNLRGSGEGRSRKESKPLQKR